MSLDWPVAIEGVTESIAATLGPNDRWNLAALGLHAGDPVTARTWGHTRTRGNFERQGGGYIVFAADPVLFVEAALGIREADRPVPEGADAWAAIDVERIDTGTSDGTDWAEWALTPTETGIERERVPTINRGYNAVIEATVAASRLDVDAYDTATLLDRLAYLESVTRRCGGDRDRAAFDRLNDLVDRPE
ncbi:MAG: DUF447 family protein [Halobacteriales archaeon]|nr:DUF447 family protein [Halobacteriales archaeon]